MGSCTHYCLIMSFSLVILITESNCYDRAKNESEVKRAVCEACEMFVGYFYDAMERTGGYSYGGGDSAWEKEHLGSYVTSEIRFIEIQEGMCDNVINKYMCVRLSELWEDYLETWWLHGRQDTPDLVQYLCVDRVKLCPAF
uniref:Saposin B-type domain-containing protein n=1 Tax=Graphocephala atropunctata TaxID=36148 RepID=A0A1B6K8T9_9HEMI